MRSQNRRPRFTKIAQASDFCKDYLMAQLDIKQNSTIFTLLKGNFNTIVQSLNDSKDRITSNSKSPRQDHSGFSRESIKNNFFPFRKLSSKLTCPAVPIPFIDISKSKQENKTDKSDLSKSNELKIEVQTENNSAPPRINHIIESSSPFNSIVHNKKPKYAIRETNRLWKNAPFKNTQIEEQVYKAELSPLISKNYNIQTDRNVPATLKDEKDPYFTERNKRKAQARRYHDIKSNKIIETYNPFMVKKQENDRRRDSVNPFGIEIKASRRILKDSERLNDRAKYENLDKFRRFQTDGTQNNPIRKLYHTDTVQNRYDNFPDKLVNEYDTGDLKPGNITNKFGKATHDKNINEEGKNFGYSVVKKILKQEGERIKKEIEAIKSNLESYRLPLNSNKMNHERERNNSKKANSDHLHALIKNNLYSQ